MNRIFDFVKVRHANAMNRPGAVNPAPLWRRVFIALALAITVGSAGQTPPAQAAPAGAKYAYFVFATIQGGENATICVGDNMPISVNVVRASTDIQPDSLNISGIWVAGLVQDPGIGKLIIDRKKTGFDYEQPGTAGFIFHADKPGKTTLFFNAEIHYYKSTILKWIYGPAKTAVSNLVSVKVEDCKFKVTATSHWKLNGVNFEAFIVEAELTADAPDHYTGKATVNWVISLSPGDPCPSVATSTSKADMTGVMDADGKQLVVDVAYQLWDTYWVYYIWDTLISECSGRSESHMLYTPDPLTLKLPASGGSLTLSQVLVHQIYAVLNMTGSADATVIPVTSH